MLIFYAHFSNSFFSDTSSSPRSRCFSSFHLLHHHPEFNNNHVKARETRKSIKFSFSSPSIAFLCFFLLVCCLFIISLVWFVGLHHFLSRCVYFWIALCVFFSSFGLSHSHHSFRFINLQPFRRIRRNPKSEEENEKRVTSQGYNKTTIFVQSRRLLSAESSRNKKRFKIIFIFDDYWWT